jgi:hypothetical protein
MKNFIELIVASFIIGCAFEPIPYPYNTRDINVNVNKPKEVPPIIDQEALGDASFIIVIGNIKDPETTDLFQSYNNNNALLIVYLPSKYKDKDTNGDYQYFIGIFNSDGSEVLSAQPLNPDESIEVQDGEPGDSTGGVYKIPLLILWV